MKKLFSGILIIFLCSICVEGKEDYSIILKRNIFTSQPPRIPKVEKKTILKPPPPPPGLDTLIEIVGIFYFKEGPSYVIIRGKRDRKEGIYKEGDRVEGAEIVKIEKDKVIFKYNGETIAISFENKIEPGKYISVKNVEVKREPQKVVIPEPKGSFIIDFGEALHAIKKDKLLLKNINIAPYVRKGKIEGFRISRIPSNSLPYKYGFRNGDVIRRVNGILIDSLSKGFEVYKQILESGVKLVTVEVLRNGKPILLTYRVR